MKKKMKQGIGMGIGSVFLLFGFLPLFLYGIFHVGVITLLLMGVAWFAPLFLPRQIQQKKIWRWLWVGNATITAIGVIIALGMFSYAHLRTIDARDTQGTVIVLGCQVIEDQPSVMLKKRLDAAKEILQENPWMQCVVSGGLSEGNSFSEAEVMYRYLVQQGIEEERIWREEKSVSTESNLLFSAKVIRENQLSETVWIATDAFHQLRSSVYAFHNGLTPYSVPCSSPWSLAPSYYVREQFALAKAILMDLD